jgi:NitT/TauT family transport system substrate-binding protein
LAAGLAIAGSARWSAFGQTLTPVRFGYPQGVVTASAVDMVIGKKLGYYESEGLTFDILTLGQTAVALAAFDDQTIEVGFGTLSFMLPMFVKGDLPPIVNFFESAYPYKYDIGVPPGSSIKRYEDLAGKNIGVTSLGVTDYAAAQAVLRSLGIDPEIGVNWIVVGQGLAAAQALEQGVVDAIAAHDIVFGTFEGAGVEIDLLPRPDKLPYFGGNFIAARRDMLESNPEIFVGFGRANRKSQEFILANPEAACAIFLELYPELVPRGTELKDAIASMLPVVDRRAQLYKPTIEGLRVGEMSMREYEESAEFLALDVSGDMQTLFTNELIDDINDFDIAAIQDAARAYVI